MSQHDALTAVPTTASGDPVVKDLLHNLLIVRYPYVFGDGEDPEALEAVDADTGSIPLALVYNGGLFTLDEADTTTAHDGVTCLVTDDGKRYKRETVDFDIRSVLDKDETDPPEDALLGDRYLVPVGASGDWGSHPEDIAIFTARGWVYVEPKIGHLLYVEDEDSFYHFNASGDWIEGVGQSALAAGSVRSSHLLGGRTHWVVISQSTNTPPVSPSTGDAYIVGGTPTGDWVGHTGKIAQWSGATWLIYSPAEGWTAYDQNTDTTYVYSGSAWVSQRGAIIFHDFVFTESGSNTTGGSGNYTYSSGTAPTTTFLYREETPTLARAARRSGAVLRFSYDFSGAAGNNTAVIALFRGSEPNAIAWSAQMSDARQGHVTFIVTASDTALHTYKIRLVGTAGAPGNVTRRLFQIEEFA